MIQLLLNLLWAIFGGGFILALEYLLAGLLCCLTIVGIPFGLQCFKLAGLAVFPFGKTVDNRARTGLGSALANLLWFLFAGIWICITHLAAALALAVTIIGIPFALQHIKFALIALFPFGAEIRTSR